MRILAYFPVIFTGLQRDYLTGLVRTKKTGTKTNNKRKNNGKKEPLFACYLLIAEKQEVFFVAVTSSSTARAAIASLLQPPYVYQEGIDHTFYVAS